jgi:hypothetical protein
VHIKEEEDIVSGDFYRITFEIQDGLSKGEKISHSFYNNKSGYITTKESLGKAVKELLGPLMDGDEIDLRDLIGKDCWIAIEMKDEQEEIEARTYPRIVDVKTTEKMK